VIRSVPSRINAILLLQLLISYLQVSKGIQQRYAPDG
jgi:hypothetical protein